MNAFSIPLLTKEKKKKKKKKRTKSMLERCALQQ